MRRLIFSALCIGLLAAMALLGARLPAAAGRVQAAAAPAVKVAAWAGFDGLASVDAWAPLRVEITNQGAALNGRLVARQIQGQDIVLAEYGLPLALPEGTLKRLNLTIPTQRGVGTVDVSYEAGGQTVATTRVSMQVGGPSDVLVGVLSREPLALQALTQVKLSGRTGNVRVARLTQETLPDNLTLLSSFDLLAVARFDTATLTPAQSSALDTWVRRGGMLVLVGGPEWRGTLAGLPAGLVPVRAQGTRDVDNLPVLAALGGKELPQRGRPFALTTTTLSDAQPLALDGGDPVIAVGHRGRGTVLFFAVDLTLDPFASWTGAPTLWETLLLQYSGQGFWSGTDRADSNPALMARALADQPLVATPNLRPLAYWLLGYLLLIGPLGYGVLALLKRRWAIWVLVPLASIGAVTLLWHQGFVVEHRNVMSRSVSVTELTPGLDGAASRSYLAVFAPSRDDVHIDLGPGDLASPLAMPGGATPLDGALTRVSLDPPAVDLAGLNLWAPQGLEVGREVPGIGQIEADLQIKGTTLVGTLTNATDRTIHDAVLITPAGHEVLPVLKPGDSARLDVSLLGYARSFRPLFQDILPSLSFKDVREQLFRRRVMEAAVGATRDALPAPILFLGWTDEAPSPLTAAGRPVAGAHLIYSPIQPRMDPQNFDLPPGVIVGRLVASDGQQRGRSPRGFFLQNGSLTFSLQLPAIDRSVLQEVSLSLTTGGPPGSARVRLLNWQTGQWDEFDVAKQPQPPSFWAPYLAPDGSLLLRVEVKDEGQEIQTPSLSLRGR